MSALSLADVYSYNPSTGRLTRWTYSEAGGLNPKDFPETKLYSFTRPSTRSTVSARMIPAFITRPGARFKPSYPVLIDIHGGPEGTGASGPERFLFDQRTGVSPPSIPNVRGIAAATGRRI